LKNSKTLLLTLKIFSATGGIEKVCRVAGKALYESALLNNRHLSVYSMYDKKSDADENIYFPNEIFKGFEALKIKCIASCIVNSRKFDMIILSHINLLMVGWLMKMFNPKIKLVLIAHGIEIWGKLDSRKTSMLKSCDIIVPVSHFTSDRIQQNHGIKSYRIRVLNNCLDPFLSLGKKYKNNEVWRAHLGFNKSDKILFTLTRLSSKERYKGYDKVIESVAELRLQYPEIIYVIAGSCDVTEKSYLNDLIKRFDVEKNVRLIGFVKDSELAIYFSIADLYVMPSLKEGFGIVFIEAMFYGLPVIAGNRDGSVDALSNGQLGLLVDPLDKRSITTAIEKIIRNKDAYIPDRNVLLEKFSYQTYKNNLDKLLFN